MLRRLFTDKRGSSDLQTYLLLTAAGCTMVGLAAPSMFKSSKTAEETFDKQVQILQRGASPGGGGSMGGAGGMGGMGGFGGGGGGGLGGLMGMTGGGGGSMTGGGGGSMTNGGGSLASTGQGLATGGSESINTSGAGLVVTGSGSGEQQKNNDPHTPRTAKR